MFWRMRKGVKFDVEGVCVGKKGWVECEMKFLEFAHFRFFCVDIGTAFSKLCVCVRGTSARKRPKKTFVKASFIFGSFFEDVS